MEESLLLLAHLVGNWCSEYVKSFKTQKKKADHLVNK